MGAIRGTGWEAGDLQPESKVLNGSAPLVISLGNLAEVNLTWPQQQLTIATDTGNFQVCIPGRTLKPGSELFYLGVNNQLYSDALLRNVISC